MKKMAMFKRFTLKKELTKRLQATHCCRCSMAGYFNILNHNFEWVESNKQNEEKGDNSNSNHV